MQYILNFIYHLLNKIKFYHTNIYMSTHQNWILYLIVYVLNIILNIYLFLWIKHQMWFSASFNYAEKVSFVRTQQSMLYIE